MKIAREIAEEARHSGYLSTGARGSSVHVTWLIDEEFEKFIAAKLEPVKELLKRIKSDVICEGVPLVEPEYNEHDNICSPRMALCSIGAKAVEALSVFEDQ